MAEPEHAVADEGEQPGAREGGRAEIPLRPEDQKALDDWRKEEIAHLRKNPVVDPVYAAVRGRIDRSTVSPEDQRTLQDKFGPSIWSKKGKGVALDILEAELADTPEWGARLRDDFGADNLFSHLIDHAKSNRANREEAIREIDQRYEQQLREIRDGYGREAERESRPDEGQAEGPSGPQGDAPGGPGGGERADSVDDESWRNDPNDGRHDVPFMRKMGEPEGGDAPEVDPHAGPEPNHIRKLRESVNAKEGLDLQPGAIREATVHELQLGADAAKDAATAWDKHVTFLKLFGKARLFHGLILDGDPYRIYVDADTPKPYMVVVGHEIGEHLKLDFPTIYDKLRDVARAEEQDLTGYQGRLNKAIQDSGRGALASRAEARDELINDFIGERMDQKSFWYGIAKLMPTEFREVARAVQRIVLRTLGRFGSKSESKQHFRDVKAVGRAVDQVMADYRRLMNEGMTPKEHSIVEQFRAFFQRVFHGEGELGDSNTSTRDSNGTTSGRYPEGESVHYSRRAAPGEEREPKSPEEATRIAQKAAGKITYADHEAKLKAREYEKDIQAVAKAEGLNERTLNVAIAIHIDTRNRPEAMHEFLAGDWADTPIKKANLEDYRKAAEMADNLPEAAREVADRIQDSFKDLGRNGVLAMDNAGPVEYIPKILREGRTHEWHESL